ncbi:hypothetical protein HYALB_00009681 [Hymenoscyphus albidus]|uniref:Uncharacterized protein n=1 Tax=Hymenoscyphus albidus TaxID=595503 RepID=A0A9N9LEJ9_9HELO|nr:hypothetical protein HYALB_00009681 [Hymenoscyphus albidus]
MHSSILVLVAAFASVMASPQRAGPLPPSTPTAFGSSSVTPARVLPATPIKSTYSPTTTATGLPLGAECHRKIAGACANGVECYATNVLLKPRCGNYKAQCTTDDQCAYHLCVREMCVGFKQVNGTRPSTIGLASGGSVPTPPSNSGGKSGGNSSAILSLTGPTPTGPAQANEVARIGGSLAGLLALAALVALAF